MAARHRKPSTIQIAGHAISIVPVDGLQAAEGLNGDWNEVRLRIRIDSSLTGSRRQEIILHECIHAISTLNGLNLEESQVRTLGLGLQQMLAPALGKVA